MQGVGAICASSQRVIYVHTLGRRVATFRRQSRIVANTRVLVRRNIAAGVTAGNLLLCRLRLLPRMFALRSSELRELVPQLTYLLALNDALEAQLNR